MKIQIIHYLLACCFLAISCKSNHADTLEDYLSKVDNLPLSESFYVLEVDSSNIVKDTIEYRKLKYNGSKDLIFENNIRWGQNLETVNYYDSENGLLYSKTKKDDEIFSKFRVSLKKGIIASARYIVYDNGKNDTVSMKYHYTFEQEKKAKLLIDSGDNFITVEIYNEFEKPVLNASLHENDTIERTEFFYGKNNVLIKKRVRNFSRGEEFIYDYDEGHLTRERFLKDGIQKLSATYYRDKQGNHLRHTKVKNQGG